MLPHGDQDWREQFLASLDPKALLMRFQLLHQSLAPLLRWQRDIERVRQSAHMESSDIIKDGSVYSKNTGGVLAGKRFSMRFFPESLHFEGANFGGVPQRRARSPVRNGRAFRVRVPAFLPPQVRALSRSPPK